MTPFAVFALALLANLPDLHERDRFPILPVVNAHLGFLIEARSAIRTQLVLQPAQAAHWRRALEANDHALRCWELLLEAHGALAEEEGGRGDAETCCRALAALRRLIGEDAWQCGRMP